MSNQSAFSNYFLLDKLFCGCCFGPHWKCLRLTPSLVLRDHFCWIWEIIWGIKYQTRVSRCNENALPTALIYLSESSPRQNIGSEGSPPCWFFNAMVFWDRKFPTRAAVLTINLSKEAFSAFL